MSFFEALNGGLRSRFDSIDAGISCLFMPTVLQNKVSNKYDVLLLNNRGNDGEFVSAEKKRSFYDGTKMSLVFTLRALTLNKKYKFYSNFVIYDLYSSVLSKNKHGSYHFVFDNIFGYTFAVFRNYNTFDVLSAKFRFSNFDCSLGFGGYISCFYVNVISDFERKIPLIFGPCFSLNCRNYQMFLDGVIYFNLTYFLYNSLSIICHEDTFEIFSKSVSSLNATNVLHAPISFEIAFGGNYLLNKCLPNMEAY